MGICQHTPLSPNILQNFDTVGSLRAVLQDTCTAGRDLTLWVGRFHKVPWYITRLHMTGVSPLSGSGSIPVSCLTASVPDRWVKHQGVPLRVPWSALKLATELALSPHRLWTRETVNHGLTPSEQWSPSAWHVALHDIRKTLPAHLHRLRGLGYTFQSCLALPPFPMGPTSRSSGASIPLGWVKLPRNLTWTVLLSVHQILDVIPTAEVTVFALAAWTDDRDWLDALLEQAWLSTAHVWLWDEGGYVLSRTRHSVPEGSIEQLDCLEIDWTRHQMRHRGHPVGLPWRAIQLLALTARHTGQALALEDFDRYAAEVGWSQWSEDSLHVVVHHIRQHIGCSHIQTVPGRGYQFVPCSTQHCISPSSSSTGKEC